MHTFYELRKMKPRLQKLRSLLEENPYAGQVAEGDVDHQGTKVCAHWLFWIVVMTWFWSINIGLFKLLIFLIFPIVIHIIDNN